MKKSTKKLVSVLLASAMAAGMLAGCGSGNGNGSTGDSKSSSAVSGTSGDNLNADTSEHVDLTMYLIGDRTPDFDEVYAKINEILEEKLNCSLNVEFLSWGEHDTKYSLLFSSQEDFDLIFTASSWCHYEQTVSLGGFAPLSEDFIQAHRISGRLFRKWHGSRQRLTDRSTWFRTMPTSLVRKFWQCAVT